MSEILCYKHFHASPIEIAVFFLWQAFSFLFPHRHPTEHSTTSEPPNQPFKVIGQHKNYLIDGFFCCESGLVYGRAAGSVFIFSPAAVGDYLQRNYFGLSSSSRASRTDRRTCRQTHIFLVFPEVQRRRGKKTPLTALSLLVPNGLFNNFGAWKKTAQSNL